MKPFVFVKAIQEHRDIVRSGEASINDYNRYITNLAFSYYPDTILYANEVNINNCVDNMMHYDYYMSVVQPKRRKYVEWGKKKAKSDDVELIRQAFGVNYTKAIEICRVLTKSQIEMIKEKQKGE